MSVIIRCPNCDGRLKVGSRAINRPVRCPKCSFIFSATMPSGAWPPTSLPSASAAAPQTNAGEPTLAGARGYADDPLKRRPTNEATPQFLPTSPSRDGADDGSTEADADTPPTPSQIFTAFGACIGVFLLYLCICVAFGWTRGGGTIVIMILFSSLIATWKAVMKPRRKRPPVTFESPPTPTERVWARSSASEEQQMKRNQFFLYASCGALLVVVGVCACVACLLHISRRSGTPDDMNRPPVAMDPVEIHAGTADQLQKQGIRRSSSVPESPNTSSPSGSGNPVGAQLSPVPYVDDEHGFFIQFPVGWEVKQSISGMDNIAIKAIHRGSDHRFATLIVYIEDPRDLGIDFASANAEELFRASGYSDGQLLGSGEITLAGQKALWLKFRLDDSLTSSTLAYALVHDDTLFVLFGQTILGDEEWVAQNEARIVSAIRTFRFVP